jgi:hypothetical protein
MPWLENTGVMPCDPGLIVEVRIAGARRVQVGRADSWDWRTRAGLQHWRVFGATKAGGSSVLVPRRAQWARVK